MHTIRKKKFFRVAVVVEEVNGVVATLKTAEINMQESTLSRANHEYDFVIVGAGLSGIGCAYYIAQNFPGKSLKIFESRAALGGTWDLFRYPGEHNNFINEQT